jgi:superfamily II DNA or RNA helicase
MSNYFEESFEYKLIYIFEIQDDAHKGLLKIGDATIKTEDSIDSLSPSCKALNQAAKNRIKQYTNTAGIKPILLHTELAIRSVKGKDGKLELKAFRDYQVHRVLDNSHIQKKTPHGTTGREWYKVDLETVKRAIEAVKKCQNNLSNIPADNFTPIVFRPEQLDAINKTLKQFKSGNRMLWNAKMRFGKTLSALEVIHQSDFNHTIIITHRPVVDVGWYEDFTKIFHGEDNYVYGSKNSGYTVEQLLDSDKKFVYFASMQDLRGSDTVGGKFDKNDAVFSLNWDFVIVDEAHEGTTTALGDDVIKNIVKEGTGHDTKFLALSGTPFNILRNYEDNSIYTWDYVMEQSRKAEWTSLNFGDSNPYDELPELKIFTYDLGKLIKNKKYMDLEDKAFNFRKFFRVWTGDVRVDQHKIPAGQSVGNFCDESDVRSFLNLITKEDTTSNYPYSTLKYRELFIHSLWMVPGVKEAMALSKMMKAHPVFGCGQFNIVNVAGDGDKDEESKDALQKVRHAIDTAGDGYTITLSCGKLTTGVTVPEWTAVFMLSGSFSTSAANYLQTIFRVQSPCNKDGKIKQCCYVFDFAPDRTLKMVAESVAISTKAGKTGGTDRKILGDFLNYCPVISIDGTQMKKYNTNNLLQQLKRAYAERAVQNGFDDTNLYNDELLKLDGVALDDFANLKKIIGTSKAQQKTNEIDINSQGFTEEEYEDLNKIKDKKSVNVLPRAKKA